MHSVFVVYGSKDCVLDPSLFREVCLDVLSNYMNFNTSNGFRLIPGEMMPNIAVPHVAKTAIEADPCQYDLGFSQGILGIDTLSLVSPSSTSSPPSSLKIKHCTCCTTFAA
ncbi:hypothetical protein ACFX13_022508 [Malus domestica]